VEAEVDLGALLGRNRAIVEEYSWVIFGHHRLCSSWSTSWAWREPATPQPITVPMKSLLLAYPLEKLSLCVEFDFEAFEYRRHQSIHRASVLN